MLACILGCILWAYRVLIFGAHYIQNARKNSTLERDSTKQKRMVKTFRVSEKSASTGPPGRAQKPLDSVFLFA